MELEFAVFAAVVGYLLGSLSFARIITRRVAPQVDISRIEHLVPDSDIVFTSDSVSATAVRLHAGTRYGVTTALLDMLKVLLPVLALKLWQPELPYFLIAAAAGIVGHDYPLFYRFQGGRGESPIYGGMLVIDPLGAVATTVFGAVLGALIGNVLAVRWGGLILLIPWLWFRTHDPAHLIYILFANTLYWYAMSPELGQYLKLRDANLDPSQEALAEFMGMGVGLGRFLDRYSLPALFKSKGRPKDDHAADLK
jgi:acyl phosphate:glycerol-3-phosphate acyltransferase